MTNDPLVARLRALFADEPVAEQRMFGGLCFMAGGHMLVCASKRGLLVRVGKEGHAAALAKPHVSPMQMGGRTMAGYVVVDGSGTSTDRQLRAWIDVARAVVAALPAKASRPAKPRQTRKTTQ
jgi:TfoX/Sxy family transcriptional regulator of competence genes